MSSGKCCSKTASITLFRLQFDRMQSPVRSNGSFVILKPLQAISKCGGRTQRVSVLASGPDPLSLSPLLFCICLHEAYFTIEPGTSQSTRELWAFPKPAAHSLHTHAAYMHLPMFTLCILPASIPFPKALQHPTSGLHSQFSVSLRDCMQPLC